MKSDQKNGFSIENSKVFHETVLQKINRKGTADPRNAKEHYQSFIRKKLHKMRKILKTETLLI